MKSIVGFISFGSPKKAIGISGSNMRIRNIGRQLISIEHAFEADNKKAAFKTAREIAEKIRKENQNKTNFSFSAQMYEVAPPIMEIEFQNEIPAAKPANPARPAHPTRRAGLKVIYPPRHS